MHKNIKNRLTYIICAFLIIAGVIGLIIKNFDENISFYYSPTDFKQLKIYTKKYRIGGYVKKHSLKYQENGTITFQITDFNQSLLVRFKGLLPAIFREEQGVIAIGEYKDNIFHAKKILAKHDETYKPPVKNYKNDKYTR